MGTVTEFGSLLNLEKKTGIMASSVQAVWEKCLDSVAREVSSQAYRTWFEPLRPLALDQQRDGVELVLEVPSRFYGEWLSQHYTSLLHSAVNQAVGAGSRVSFIVNGKANVAEPEDDPGCNAAPTRNGSAAPQAPERAASRPPRPVRPLVAAASPRPPAERPAAPEATTATPVRARNLLNPAYTFDRFIEGDCNRLGRSAALAIAERPGQTSFNPFLVYGGVGLGKTHLVQAIANHAQAANPALRVLYVSSEQFTSDFVRAIQHHMVAEFTQFYRDIDLLIVDDVQFFGGKEKTQEEFFHVFNDLHQRGKQLVLCADRPPREIPGIEERLLSRFQWGLTTDLQPPDEETRMAILRHKAAAAGLDLPDDVVAFIAGRIRSNIRELEGALTRLMAHAALQKRTIDLPFAHDALRDLIAEAPLHLGVEDIQRVVAEYYRLTPQLLLSRTRKREIAAARQLAMYFCKQYTSHTLERIGHRFGGRDHSTVIHAVATIENRLDVETSFRKEADQIRRQLDPRGC